MHADCANRTFNKTMQTVCDRVLGLALCHSRENLENEIAQETFEKEGSWLSPLATMSKNRNSEALTSLFGTGDFEQLSSEIARKEVKCHLRLLQEVVHQNEARRVRDRSPAKYHRTGCTRAGKSHSNSCPQEQYLNVRCLRIVQGIARPMRQT